VADSFRFRPRYAPFAWGVAAVGVALLVCIPVFSLQDSARTFALACGVTGPILAALYLGSPAWRLRVDVDDDALTVRRGEDVRFRLAWSEVRSVVASPSTKTCFVDGGAPERSLLVPGPGAPGPYRLEKRERLYDLIVARAPADRVKSVETLEQFRPAAGPG
jgi:hypothetical protein